MGLINKNKKRTNNKTQDASTVYDGVYLDYAATTPASSRALRAMEPYFSEKFANPSSLHIPGQNIQSDLDTARQDVADILGANWKEVFFVASATHSINFALRGVIKEKKNTTQTPHIITTNIEHSAVLNTCKDLEKNGAEVTYLEVNEEGLVSAGDVKKALKENTVLVSIMYVNNEIGTIQPIKEIAEALKEHDAYFHTDAVQAANYLNINVKDLGVDLMTLSGHKIYGPKGVGLLYKKEGVDIEPTITGGEQERKMSAGTENIPAIMGFAEALKETKELKEKEAERVCSLRDTFIEKVLAEAPGVGLNGSRKMRSSNNVNFYFEKLTSEILIPLFDSRGIYISGGSACTSRTPEPSHVITALGRGQYAKNSIRITLGRHTTREDVTRAAEAFISIAKEHYN